MSDEQYFTTQPQVASVAHSKHQNFAVLRAAEREITIGTDRGVFSRKGIDQGTMVLLESAARPPSTGNFLDLGCGAGPIALTLAAYSPNATVYAIDINERARELTESNAQHNNLLNVVSLAPHEVDDSIRFDVMWSNPPIRIGKQELHTLLLTWLSRLSTTGEAWLVVNRNLGADSLAVWLTSQGYSVERLTSKRGFRVLRVKPTHVPDQPEFSA
ncbi:MAG: methyltransferase [Actinomycetota bacterium]|jgi:SAM-dependent methyltransferase